jgi:DNA-binding MarR family transcriptional regulator
MAMGTKPDVRSGTESNGVPEIGRSVRVRAREDSIDELEAAFALMARKGGLPRLHERLTAATGLTLDHSSTQLIRRLADAGPIRLSEVALQMGLDLSTVSRLVAHLEAMGLVERRTDDLDRRASLLSLSSSGRLVSAKICEGRRDLFTQILSEWDERDVRRFAALVTRFAHDLASFAERRPPTIPKEPH